MTRVLITNAYSARNRGDAAIILGMIESLRRTDAFQDAEIRISSADHPVDSGRYPVPVVSSFHSIKNGFSRNSSANLLYFLAVLLPMSLVWALAWRAGRLDLPLPSTVRGLLRTYADADVVVAAGGGYLYTTSAIHGNVVLLTNVYAFFFAVLLGKPVCLYAQSIGPFAGSWQRWLVRRALSRVALGTAGARSRGGRCGISPRGQSAGRRFRLRRCDRRTHGGNDGEEVVSGRRAAGGLRKDHGCVCHLADR